MLGNCINFNLHLTSSNHLKKKKTYLGVGIKLSHQNIDCNIFIICRLFLVTFGV